MSVAYLVNQYPKVSHTFIRRELRALEDLGVTVHRFSIRPNPDPATDADDAEEERRTEILLETPLRQIGRSMLEAAARNPGRLARCVALAARLGLHSNRGLARHAAYVVEAAALKALCEARGVTHLHAHFGTNPATVAMLCRELGGPTWSFTVHGPEEFDEAARIGLAEKIRRARFVVAISSFGKSQLLRRADSAARGKIHVVRCGVDASYLSAETCDVPEEPRLVCVGRLSEQKGHHVLLDAAAELRRRGRKFELVLVGDGELRADIEKQIAENGLSGHVRITGWLDGEAVRHELERARALVLPSFAEGLPVVIMEALALGRPVVSTFVAGIPELVEHEKSGWLVPAGSSAALADALEAALSAPPEVLGRMGARGRERVRAAHDVAASARSLATLMTPEAST